MSNKRCVVHYEVQIKYIDDESPQWVPCWIELDELPKDHPAYRDSVDGWAGDMRTLFDDQATAEFVYEKFKKIAQEHDLEDRRYRIVRVNTREIISDE